MLHSLLSRDRVKVCAKDCVPAGTVSERSAVSVCMSLIDENAIFELQRMGGDGNGPSMPFFTLLNLAIKGVLTGPMSCCVKPGEGASVFPIRAASGTEAPRFSFKAHPCQV
jgi:hypothetical protein